MKENRFLGFGKVNLDETVKNYEKAFKSYNIQLAKNRQNLEVQKKLIDELQSQNKNYKKEITNIKYKHSNLLSNVNFYISEKQQYLNSAKETLIKSLQFEKLRQPGIFKTTKENFIAVVNDTSKKVCQENKIPFSAIEEILKSQENTSKILSLFNFGDSQVRYDSENIPQQQKKKNRQYRPK